MRVAVVHNAVTDDSPADEQDVLVQVDAVREALRALGHEAYRCPPGWSWDSCAIAWKHSGRISCSTWWSLWTEKDV